MKSKLQKPGSALGPMESQFFAYCQMEGTETVRTGEVARAFGITPVQERELLYRLARDGWIIRLRRGLYLVPPKLPPGGSWMPGEALVLARLMEDRGGRYQLCGPNAFYFWGLEDQVPNRVYAYNNRISGERKIGVIRFTFIKLADERLGAVVERETAAGIPLVVGSKARTLMDAVYDWKRFGSLPRAYIWIREELARDPGLGRDLAEVCLRYGNQATARRIGFLLQTSGVSPRILRPLRENLRSSKSLVTLMPGRPRRGPIDRDWGVIINEDCQAVSPRKQSEI